MRSQLTVLGSVGLASMLLSGAAVAAESTNQTTDNGGLTVAAHKVKGKGKGNLVLDATGKAKIRRRGDMRIVDHAGDAVVHIRPTTNRRPLETG